MRPLPGIVCDQCGAEGLELVTGWAKLRHWFVNGSGLRAQIVTCRGCGSSGTRGWGYLVSDGARTWRVPLRLLDEVRRERRWHPVPIFYAYVGAAAGALATVAAVIARASQVWRWPPAAAFCAMVGVFVLSIVSAFRGGGAVHAIREVVRRQPARGERRR